MQQLRSQQILQQNNQMVSSIDMSQILQHGSHEQMNILLQNLRQQKYMYEQNRQHKVAEFITMKQQFMADPTNIELDQQL